MCAVPPVPQAVRFPQAPEVSFGKLAWTLKGLHEASTVDSPLSNMINQTPL
jgi:hypothetical protein